MPRAAQLIGKTFGRLTVIEERGRSKRGQIMWACRCECGAMTTVATADLMRGNTKSCGCYRRDIRKANLR